MEPRQSGPVGGYEQGATGQGYVERSPVAPESIGDATRERPAVNVERQERASLSPPTAPPTAPVLPTPVIQDTPTAVAVSDDSTMLAADEDLIEKEWVDRAKKILNDTKDNPYARELEVSKLQAEYIQKRYGKIIGSTTD